MANLNITLVGPKTVNNNSITALQHDLPVSISKIKSIEELFPMLSNPNYNTDIIAIDIEHFYEIKGVEVFDIINTLKTLISCTVSRKDKEKAQKRNIKIMCMAGDNTPVTLLRNTNKIVDKILLRECDSFSYTDIKDDISQIINGDFSNHKKIQNLIKKTKVKNDDPILNKDNIKLTPRQEQILNIVSSRGASNKIIAKMLKISESTVKLHISSILKKYGVKNRTQLVLFSKQK